MLSHCTMFVVCFFSLAVCLFWVWNTFSPVRTSVIHRDVNIFGWFDTFGLIWVHVDLGYSKHSIVCWITDYLFVCLFCYSLEWAFYGSIEKEKYIHTCIWTNRSKHTPSKEEEKMEQNQINKRIHLIYVSLSAKSCWNVVTAIIMTHFVITHSMQLISET